MVKLQTSHTSAASSCGDTTISLSAPAAISRSIRSERSGRGGKWFGVGMFGGGGGGEISVNVSFPRLTCSQNHGPSDD
jgi:hypothetical protein